MSRMLWIAVLITTVALLFAFMPTSVMEETADTIPNDFIVTYETINETWLLTKDPASIRIDSFSVGDLSETQKVGCMTFRHKSSTGKTVKGRSVLRVTNDTQSFYLNDKHSWEMYCVLTPTNMRGTISYAEDIMFGLKTQMWKALNS